MPRPDVNMERKMSKKPETTLPQRKSTLQLHLAMLSRRVAGDQDGASAVEYALIASGIGAVVAVTVWTVNAVSLF
jgi:Flp pilus assembly pilin Flp